MKHDDLVFDEVGHLLCSAAATVLTGTHGLIADQNASKDNLQRLRTFASDINQCIKEVGVPLSYCCPEAITAITALGKWKGQS